MGMRFPEHSRRIIRTKRWRGLRLEVLRRDGWQCVKCGARGRLEVDHVRPVRDHPDGAFDMANLQTLCPPCHTQKTRIECGHPPPDPRRAAWREAVAELATKT